jgi:negative regulator of flagellin synthesis FlgM
MIDSTSNVTRAGVVSTNKVNRTQEPDAKDSASSSAAIAAADSVDITAQSEEMLAASEISKGVDGVDLDKIENIKAALSEGSYPLDSERTAKNMIELEGLLSDIGKK